MTTRRDFLKTSGLSLAGLALGKNAFAHPAAPSQTNTILADYVSQRPAPAQRQFTSDAVEKAI